MLKVPCGAPREGGFTTAVPVLDESLSISVSPASSIQLNLALLGLHGLSAPELTDLDGLIRLPVATVLTSMAVIQLGRLVASFMFDITSSKDF